MIKKVVVNSVGPQENEQPQPKLKFLIISNHVAQNVEAMPEPNERALEKLLDWMACSMFFLQTSLVPKCPQKTKTQNKKALNIRGATGVAFGSARQELDHQPHHHHSLQRPPYDLTETISH